MTYHIVAISANYAKARGESIIFQSKAKGCNPYLQDGRNAVKA
jgi:hypothetical protein